MHTSPATDTIVALATPPGRGGIGLLRISGPDALTLASHLLRDPHPWRPRRATLQTLVDPDTGQRLDDAILTWFRAPHSYTAEDVVEIAAHGSPIVLQHLLRLLVSAGARLAEPGEFTERAFLNGRIDLTQAEAVRDLVDAQTLSQAQIASTQLGGALSRRVAPAKQLLIGLVAHLEAGIDFAEDDTPVLPPETIQAEIRAILDDLRRLEETFEQVRPLLEGERLAIVGRPNVGKSSLFNRLLRRDRAIVTDEPGTTRDTVQEHLVLGGVPVRLIDTAGLRDATGEAERIGIEKSREALADAGLVLLVLDGVEPLHSEEEQLLAALKGRRVLVALNKCDRAAELGAVSHDAARCQHLEGATVLQTSAITGEGIEALEEQLRHLLRGSGSVASESTMLTNLRQHGAVSRALQCLDAAASAASGHVPHEMLLLDLYATLEQLDQLTGATTADDILQRIFSTFCIGK